MIDEILEQVYKSQDMRNQEEIDTFRNGIKILRGASFTENILISLLNSLSDSTEYKSVTWSLLHLIESSPIELYIDVLAKHTPQLKDLIPEWLRILYIRILNSQGDRNYLATRLRQLDDATVISIANFLQRLIVQIELTENEENSKTFRKWVEDILAKK